MPYGAEEGHNAGRPRSSIVEYDRPKSALEHALDFWLGGNGPACVAIDPSTLQVAVERHPHDTSTADYIRWFHTGTRHERASRDYYAALKLGPCMDRKTGLLAIQFDDRGAYVPNLPAGRYGPEHTYIGNVLVKTKRVVIDSVNYPPTSFAVLFGYHVSEFPDGLLSRELVQQTLDGMGSIKLLADGSYLPIEPSGGRRFYTPLFAEGPPPASSTTDSALKGSTPLGCGLDSLGIITLDRTSLEEIFDALSRSGGPGTGEGRGRTRKNNNSSRWM